LATHHRDDGKMPAIRRISVFTGVLMADVGEEQMPAVIAPERIQAH